ncbi:MAG TPA: c-type cytochrome [Anaerolineales bacterium]|nr:c-type cytochrome [Anaerolineales bacterium]
MKKFLKWAGVVFGGLVGLLIIALFAIYFKSQARLTRVYAIPQEAITLPADSASIEYGQHIFRFRGCEACHSEGGYLDVSLPGQSAESHFGSSAQDVPHMEGNIYLDDPAIGKVVASNLTGGTGGVGKEYTDHDWLRAIRHGIRPDGTPLLFMPSTEFYFLSDEDLGAVIAYIKSAPPVHHELPPSSISWTGRIVMTLVSAITFIPAELIPHDAPRPVAPEVGVTPEYGEYLTHSCKVCHGLTMSGGPIPGFPASWPPAPNLTFGPGSVLPAWSEAGFMDTLRTGVTPEGRQLRGEYMPWNSYKFMSDDELRAVWVYLQSLPEVEYGNR